MKKKEPIKIRFRKLKNGNKSIFLDTYYNKQRSHESLGLYIVPEITEEDKKKNETSLQAAMKIQSERIISLIQGKAQIKDNKLSEIKLTEWLKIYREKQEKKGIKDIGQIANLIDVVTELDPKVRLCDIDKNFCYKFLEYIQFSYISKKGKTKQKKGEHLKAVSAKNYERVMIGALNCAVRAEYIDKNPFMHITKEERIKVPESTRVYLTEEEFSKMKNAEWTNPIAKNIFVFCCYSGMRISDIRNLTWNNVVRDGYLVRIEKQIKKTQKTISIPLCSAAINLLPHKGSKKGCDKVFPDISSSALNNNIQKVAKQVGIDKAVGIHTARHTFATLLLTKDANINTIKELMGHSDIKTTMIYAKVIDKTKQKAVDLLDSI